jgi:hypothetical protein
VDFLIATIVFPLLLLLLSLGGGLLVDRGLGGRLPGALIPITGLAALVIVAELCTYWEATAWLAPWASVAVAVAGVVAGWERLRGTRPDWWLVTATLAVYVVACAPVLLSGRVTLAGYLLDTTVAFHLAGADYLIEHARNFGRLPESSFRGTMESYFGIRYPGGGQTLLGGGSRLVGESALWLYQPLLSALLAFCAAPLYYMARSVKMPRPAAAAAAFFAATPALVYAYLQMGAIKELAVLPFILLLGALLVLLPRLIDAGLRGALAPAVVGAAGVGAIGLAFVPWLLGTLLVGLLLLVLAGGVRERARELATWTVALVLMLVLLGLPTFGPIGESLTLARALSASNAALAADPGNLLRPLLPAQMGGIWLGGSHRFDPPRIQLTYALIGVMFAAAVLGLAWLVRRREWPVVGFAAVLAVVLVALTARGTNWTDAKLLVITSPMVVLLAAIGVDSLRRGGRRVEAALLAIPLALGILASNAFTYHDTNLLPTDRYEELVSIGERYSGDGPTLLPEFDEFALYALADMAPAGPGFASKGDEDLVTLHNGDATGYGHSYDVDLLRPDAVERADTIVVRRRPDASRPPANFRLAERGTYYDVWRRVDGVNVLGHRRGGGGGQPAGVIRCASIGALARGARSRQASLAFVARPRVLVLDPQRAGDLPGGWGELDEGVALSTPGLLRQRFEIEGGRYRVWLKGDFARPVTVAVDGRQIGEIGGQTGNEGNYGGLPPVALRPGRHVLTIERPGGGLQPGDGGPSRLLATVVEPPQASSRVQVMPPGRWRLLCGQSLDWVEIIRR